MSHLREPSTRADRREGRRHGRPGPRAAQPLPETHIRRQLLRAAVLPAVAVALCGAAAVLFTLRSAGAAPTPGLWAVLTGSGTVAVAGIGAAALSADRTARSLLDRVTGLRRSSARGQADLRELVERLRRGDGPAGRRTVAPSAGGGDELDLLAQELNRAHEVAVATVVQASQLSSHAGSEQKVEVFVNLARRLQSLVHREIQLLDELENDVEDPELLKGLFHVDHLATRIRRHAENLAVLGGAISRRQWSNPVTMTEVLRSAIAEVEQYSRVKLVPPIDGTLRGHAVADVIHLLAELVENASLFSAPHTQVLLRTSQVTAGLAVEVEDRGLGMPVTEQNKMNALLSDPDQVNVARLLSDGRIGLFVVSALARRHGIAVRLQNNIYGGVQAVIVLPQGLLGADSQTAKDSRDGQHSEAVPAGRDAQETPAGQLAAGAAAAHEQQAPQLATTGQVIPLDRAGGGTATAPNHAEPPAPARPAATPAASAVSSGVHVPHQPQRDEAPHTTSSPQPAPTPAPANGTSRPGAPSPPLPVRGAHEERPGPAGATPGIRPEERSAVPEHTAAPPSATPSAVRGTMGRPQLPKRRAQEHLAPQLRDAPAPLHGDGHLVGHDPGLMAAFQRGIGLAESQPEPYADVADVPPQPYDTDVSQQPYDPHRTDAPHPEAPHPGAAHPDRLADQLARPAAEFTDPHARHNHRDPAG